MKKTVSFFALLLLLLSLTAPALGFDADSLIGKVNQGNVVDNSELLTEKEEADLADKISSIRETYGLDIVILTMPDTGSRTTTQYADDFYDYNDYGYGAGDDGMLYLLNMGEREYAFSTYGKGITYFTDYGLKQIASDMSSDLSSGNYYEALTILLDDSEKYIKQGQSGSSYDVKNPVSPGYNKQSATPYVVNNTARSDEENTRNILIIAGGSVILSLVIVLVMRSGMKSRRPQLQAREYLREGSFQLTGQRDIYLYSHTSRVKRQSNNNGGGGSGVHFSSSGRSHGGSSGRF
ncbi:hypothetical protein SDC9_52318 [bioreactor metagenome]|uniref:TPM domain-containing protein n=1 Tax=bioreactor metagenome TaxID=1076179 RepID=A0A644WVB4_9ZZZZ